MDDLVNKPAEVTAAPIEGEVLGEVGDSVATEPVVTAELGAQPSEASSDLEVVEHSPLVMPDAEPKFEPAIQSKAPGVEGVKPNEQDSREAAMSTPADINAVEPNVATPPENIQELLREVGDGNVSSAMKVEKKVATHRAEAGASTAQ